MQPDTEICFGGGCTLRWPRQANELRNAVGCREIRRWRLRIPGTGSVEGLFRVSRLETVSPPWANCTLMLELRAAGRVRLQPD
jgi:predicted secreted protein